MKKKNDAEVKFKVELDGKNANSDLDNLNKKSGIADGKLSKIGSIGKTAFKAVAIGVGTATTAIAGFIGKAVTMAGELEQQIGGTEAVFKEYASTVQEMSKKAYSSAGLSANTYMATMNKMGALMQGSGIDIKTSMDLSSQAMQRAADVASIMGIDIEMAMESIAGAAKGNFTMMDNLGVAMNATTIEAYALSKGIDKSFDSMQNSEKIQMAMEMFLEKSAYAMGNYTKENKTFAGSLQTMKSAITNFMSGAGTVEDMVQSITNFAGILITKIGEIVPTIINGLISALPQLLELGTQIISSLLTGISQNSPQLIPVIMDAIFMLLDTIISMLPDLLNVGIQVILSFINGLTEKLPELIPLIINALLSMIDTIFDNIDLFIDAGISLIMGLIDGLLEALPELIDKIPVIIDKLIMALSNNMPKIIEMGIMLILKLAVGLIKAIPQLVSKIPQIINSIVKGFLNGLGKMAEVGLNLVKGLWNGIKDAKDWVLKKIKGFGTDILNGIKGIFGIKSPSKVMFEIGGYLDKGFIKGVEDMETDVNKQIDSTFGSGLDYLYNGTNNFNLNIPETAFASSQTIYINNSNNDTTKLILDGKEIAEVVNIYNNERAVAV